MSWYNEEAYAALRARDYSSFSGKYGYLMYGDYDPREHAAFYNRSRDPWENGSPFKGDGTFYMAAGIWVCFTVLLLVQGAWAFLRSHAVEKRRVCEIFQLVTSSRRAYEKPKAPTLSTEEAAQDLPCTDAAKEMGDEADGPTTSPIAQGANNTVEDGTSNGKKPAEKGVADVDDEEGLNECPLCLEEYEDGDQVSKLPCGHSFHSPCIEKWLLSTTFQARTCPNCRQTPLVSDLEFEEIENEESERRATVQVERRAAEQIHRFSFSGDDHLHRPYHGINLSLGAGRPTFNDNVRHEDYSLFGWGVFNFLPSPPVQPPMTPPRPWSRSVTAPEAAEFSMV